MSPTIIVVAGANGELGTLLCAALVRRARAAGQPMLVRGLVRKPGMASSREGEQRVEYEVVDYHRPDDLKRVCAGATTVVSTLQGLEDVIVGVQSKLLRAAIDAGASRFIPSDYSVDFTTLPAGTNRNFDLRADFHRAIDRIVAETRSSIQVTSIYQGMFTELLATGHVFLDYQKRRVTYFGSPDTVMQLTTWKDTAEYTAAVALDPRPTPRALHPAASLLTPRQLQAIAAQVTGVAFDLKRMMPIGMLRLVIGAMKLFKPEKGAVFPLWIQMQYALAMALGSAPAKSDNDRYPDLVWTGPETVIRESMARAEAKR